jgi:hypothetical protein
LGNYACYYDQEAEQEPVPDVDPDTPISFRSDIEPLFSRNGKDCTACHNGLIQNPDLRVGNAFEALLQGGYVIPNDAESSLLYQSLPGNEHPVTLGFALSTEEISLIKGWIDRGAENN